MRIFLAACLAILASCGAPSAPVSEAPEAAHASAPIQITDAWAAPTPGGVSVSAGYLTITSTQDRDDTLLAVETTRAGRAEIHEMAMQGEVMQMRRAEHLMIPAGGAVTLAPGGMHLMFYDVTAAFAVGEMIPVRLRFANAGEVTVELAVRPPSSGHSGH